MDFDAVSDELLQHARRGFRIFASERGSGVDNHHFSAEATECLTQLHANRAATDYQQASGQL